MTPDEWIKLAPDAVTAVAALLGGAGALLGVGTWRKQLRGHHSYDVARRTYVAVLKLREAVGSMRAPFIPVDEFLAAAKAEGIKVEKDEDLLTAQVNYAVQQQRWAGVVDPMNELEACVLEAEAAMSSEIREVFARLQKHIWRLKWALDHHLRRRSDPSPPPPIVSTFDEQQMSILNRPTEGEDVFDQELQAIVQEFGRVLKPYLS